MTVAHVEALRLENHFMRQSLMEKKSDEKEVVEMQKKYHQVLDLTEVSKNSKNINKKYFNLALFFYPEREQTFKEWNMRINFKCRVTQS